MGLCFGGNVVRLVKPSQNGFRVVIRTYDEPNWGLEPLHLLADQLSGCYDFEDRRPGPPEIHEQLEVTESVQRALNILTTQEKLVVQLYYGFVSTKPWSLPDIAELLKIEITAASRILRRALKKLHDPLFPLDS